MRLRNSFLIPSPIPTTHIGNVGIFAVPMLFQTT